MSVSVYRLRTHVNKGEKVNRVNVGSELLGQCSKFTNY